MNKFISWLRGKKTIISGVLSAVNAYLTAANVYDAQLGALIQTLLTLFFGAAAIQTSRLGKMGKL